MKYIIKIADKKEISKRKLNEEETYLTELKLYDTERFEEKYGKEENAYIFTNKQFADGIANIVNGKTINKDVKEVKEKAKKKAEWVNDNRPTIEEVKAYIEKEDLNLNAAEWLKYYNKVEWKTTSGEKIVNWKQKARVSSQFNDKKGIDCRIKEQKGTQKETSKEKQQNGINEEKIKELKKKIGQAEAIIKRNENAMLRDKKYENEALYKRAKEALTKFKEELKQLSK